MPGLDGQQAETKNVSSAPKQRLLCGQIRAAVAQTNPNSMPHNQRLSPLAFRLIYGLENTLSCTALFHFSPEKPERRTHESSHNP